MAYKRGARDDITNRLPLPARDIEPDINGGKPWSQSDLDDLMAAYKADADLEEIAEHLCRDWEEVTQKCAELNLDLRHQRSKRAGKEQVRKKEREYWDKEHGRRLAEMLRENETKTSP
jgi:hypothetical protein